jgi:undecaprenyl-diphosphatase
MSGTVSLIDAIMIFFSNKIRYFAIVIAFFVWASRRFEKESLLRLSIPVIIAVIGDVMMRLVIYKPRPFIKRKVGILIPSKMNSSFPSKHTLLMFALSSSVYSVHKVLGTVMMIFASMTGVSRVWLGHHYPSDVFGSAIIGVVINQIYEKVNRL